MANFSDDPYDFLDDKEPENPGDSLEDVTGDEPVPDKPFNIADEYNIPPEGADIPKKLESELDKLDGPSKEELEEIELEEEFGRKD